MDQSITDMVTILLVAVVFPVVTIGIVFLMQWVRKITRDNARANELDAINHAQTISSLTNISGAGQAQNAIVANEGTKDLVTTTK